MNEDSSIGETTPRLKEKPPKRFFRGFIPGCSTEGGEFIEGHLCFKEGGLFTRFLQFDLYTGEEVTIGG
ncbi:MAG: hypothetical protein QGD96_13605, partial [Anaerolineae bacterium]|nr:hypothetical protein [Anaerolineae bacterium]